jgi:hypothetical protein
VLVRARTLRAAYAGEAELRRRLDLMFRSPPAVYDLARAAPAPRPAPVELALVA